jgi:hypothetical protein
MSHQLNLDSVFEKLFLLQHICAGSEQYCRERQIGSEEDQGDAAYDEYWGWIKSLVSAYLLECSILVRVLIDTVGSTTKVDQLKNLDTSARLGLVIGEVVEGAFDLTIRESCNKIIHARKVIPVWKTSLEGTFEFKYWGGDYDLSGVRGDEGWRLILHIVPWAKSMERFLVEAESAELTLYVGQDWY